MWKRVVPVLSEFIIQIDKRQWGVNGRIIIPGEKLIFSVWMKHLNTLLLKEVLPLESEHL